MAHQLYDIAVNKIDGKKTTLGEFEGRVLLVVNVASACGLTPHYEGLEKLHSLYESKGLSVLGFPANEFGAQEPGSNAEIAQFCSTKFGVKFPMFEKVVVKGKGQHPLFEKLTAAISKGKNKPGEDFDAKMAKYNVDPASKDIRWNFEKFLVDRKGNVVARYMPNVDPMHDLIVKDVEKFL